MAAAAAAACRIVVLRLPLRNRLAARVARVEAAVAPKTASAMRVSQAATPLFMAAAVAAPLETLQPVAKAATVILA